MNYSEDHIALAAEYALGTLSADERALVETMMIVDHGFMEVVDAWDRKLSPLHQMVAPVEPPPHLWDNISAALGLVGPQPVVVEEPKPEPVAEQPDQASTVVAQAQPPEQPEQFVAVPESAVATESATPESAVTPVSTDTAAETPVAAEMPEIVPEPVVAQPSNVVQLAARKNGGQTFGWMMTAVAASLAGVIALQAYRPELLPEKLRVKPQIQVVEVKVPAPASALPAQFVAVLQQNAAAPAFILTVDTATKNFTVRKVGATPEPGKSYELWLVSDKLPRPRSLGVIGGSDFTIRPALSAYDTDTINKATYAVTIEPEGGSPTGVATGPIVYTGKLVESVPALPASALPR
ncbi:MAG: anti-sigma factor [Phenylobacterium sp.]|uniref:anti-sigma factor n=1 Tax=Phenylobacterium sp. TaxID=1871053 RepID=UPI002719C252|nr:anti-sigma factor [Phenylobacterium sp.]MDO8910451.1 anti-sigma factor [Phenylobacterium sp.]